MLGNTKSLYSAPVKGRGGAHAINNYFADDDQLGDFESPTNEEKSHSKDISTGLSLAELKAEQKEDEL